MNFHWFWVYPAAIYKKKKFKMGIFFSKLKKIDWIKKFWKKRNLKKKKLGNKDIWKKKLKKIMNLIKMEKNEKVGNEKIKIEKEIFEMSLFGIDKCNWLKSLRICDLGLWPCFILWRLNVVVTGAIEQGRETMSMN